MRTIHKASGMITKTLAYRQPLYPLHSMRRLRSAVLFVVCAVVGCFEDMGSASDTDGGRDAAVLDLDALFGEWDWRQSMHDAQQPMPLDAPPVSWSLTLMPDDDEALQGGLTVVQVRCSLMPQDVGEVSTDTAQCELWVRVRAVQGGGAVVDPDPSILMSSLTLHPDVNWLIEPFNEAWASPQPLVSCNAESAPTCQAFLVIASSGIASAVIAPGPLDSVEVLGAVFRMQVLPADAEGHRSVIELPVIRNGQLFPECFTVLFDARERVQCDQGGLCTWTLYAARSDDSLPCGPYREEAQRSRPDVNVDERLRFELQWALE